MAIFLAAASVPSLADIIEVNFSGFIDRSDFTSVLVNDAFSGTAFYSTDFTPFNSNPDPCPAPGPTADCTAFYRFPLTVSVSVDGSTITSVPNLEEDLQIYWSPLESSVAWNAGPNTMDITGALQSQVQSLDILGIEFEGPGSALNTWQLGATFPAINAWTNQANLIQFGTAAGIGANGEGFSGLITEVSSQVVPEPGTLALLIIGVSIGLLRRHRSHWNFGHG